MTEALPISPAEALAIELGAAVAGRKAALELERRTLAGDALASTNKEQFQVRVVEARLQAAAADPQASVGPLAALALAEAETLSEVAQAVAALAVPGGRPVGLLHLCAGLLRAARISETKARSLISLARHGRRWEGGEESLALAAEHELLFMGLRRFEALLQKGGAWDPADVEWLRLRAVSLPARLKQTAAELRAAAEAAAQSPLPPALEAARQPLVAAGFSLASGLAWSVAGFDAAEARAWMAGGVAQPAQAALWRARGFGLAQAQAWVQADLLPDEAALFGACGVSDPVLAHQLRAALGDVEMLPAWHRAGYEPDEVLALRAEGCKQPDQAPPPRPKVAVPPPPEPQRPAIIRMSTMMKDSEPGGPMDAPKASAAGDGNNAVVRVLKPVESWAQGRVERVFQVSVADEAAAWGLALPAASAWLGWGAFEPAALAAGGSAAAFVWPQAGGSLMVMGASEQWAAPGSVLELRDLRPDPLWQEGLDALRAKHSLPKHAGAWLLHAAPGQAALAWGLHFPAGAPPWAQAVDYEPSEAWTARFARKTEEWGEEGSVPAAKIGRLADGSWWVALGETLALSAVTPVSMAVGAVRPAWTEALQEFCLKMEMPSQAGHWRLFAQPLTILEH